MTHRLRIPLAGALIFALGLGLAQAGAPVRAFDWGASPRDVRARAQTPLLGESVNALTYATDIAGLDTVVHYVFGVGGLALVVYRITETPSSDARHAVVNYQRVQQALDEAHGNPAVARRFGNAAPGTAGAHEDPNRRQGQLPRHYAEWRLGGTRIRHILEPSRTRPGFQQHAGFLSKPIHRGAAVARWAANLNG